jgi:hypothetical protein
MRQHYDLLADVLADSFRYAIGAERLGCALAALKIPLELVGNAAEADPELKPELAAVVAGLDEAAQALDRAHKFLLARLEVSRDRVFGPGFRPGPPTEGDTPT